MYLPRHDERNCKVTFQVRQEGSDSLVFEDNDEDEVWDLESRVATQPLDLKGTLCGDCLSITCLDARISACSCSADAGFLF